MAKVTFSDAVQSIDNKVKAYAEKNAAARMRARFWTMCVMIAIAAVIFFLGELFSPKTDTVTFEDGCKLTFVEAGTVSAADLGFNVTTRQLTQDEASILFQDLQVTADAVYGEADDSTYRLLGFKGQCGDVKIVVSTSDVLLTERVKVGKKGGNFLRGTDVAAGYTDSVYKDTVYYMTFTLGSSRVYLENSGTKERLELTKNQLAEVAQKLIFNGAFNFTAFCNYETSIKPK